MNPIEDQQSVQGPSSISVNGSYLCLVTASHILGVPAEYEQLMRAYPLGDNEELSLLRAAQGLSLQAKKSAGNVERISSLPLPTILIMNDGRFVLLLEIVENKILFYDPLEGFEERGRVSEHPHVVTTEEMKVMWSGEAILLAKRFSFAAAKQKFSVAWFLPVMGRFKRFFAEVFLASFFLQTFGLITPLFSQVIIDKVLVHRGVRTLDVLVIGILVINTFEWILGYLRSFIFSHTTNRVDVLLGTKLFKHLLALPIPFFEARRVGEVIARVRELETIRNFLTGTALTLVLDLIFSIVFVIMMFFYSTKLALVALAALPFYIALSIVITPILRKRLQHKFECNAKNQSYMVEAVTGIGTVKSLAIEPQLNQKWEGLLSQYVKAAFKAGNLANFGSGTIQFIQKSSALAILWFGAHLVMDGGMTVGQLIAFQMMSNRVAEPVLRLAGLWQEFQQVRVSFDRLAEVLNYPPEPNMSPGRTTLGKIKGTVAIEGLNFRYRPDAPLVLENINLHVPEGTTVGIVGRSGSGKSTLTRLMQRLYMSERGRILIDGIDLTNVDPAWLRRQIGVVLQDNFLFSGTIRENIASVTPGASLDHVIKAAKLAGAHEFISELPEGYDNEVGERGTALSGGQRQRIAIARTLMTDPRILILDEATSALDYESERIIQQNLHDICRGRTVFIIAHRLSTVQRANIIISMDRGRIVEMGSHAELLRQDGLYSMLHEQQALLAGFAENEKG